MYLLSGIRTSWGRGIVGLLSFWSTIITVSVAEPANLGLPLSVAVTTSLLARKKCNINFSCVQVKKIYKSQ